MTPFFPRLRPGQAPTAADYNALSDALAAALRVGGAALGGDVGVARGLGGLQLLDGAAKGHWAKIGTGTGAAYAHRAVASNGDGTFTDLSNSDPNYAWGTATDRPAREANGDTSVAPGTYAWVWPEPDGSGWLFAAAGSASSGSSDCDSDYWLTQLGSDPRPCFTIYHAGGTGRYADFPLDDPSSPTAGIVAVYSPTRSSAGVDAWVGVQANADGGSAMVRTCCGCGLGVFKALTTGAKNARASFTFAGVHVECTDGSGSGSGSGAAGDIFSTTMEDYCVTTVGGQRAVRFTWSDPKVCDGTDAPCGSTFSMLVVCGADCPVVTCGCAGCGVTVTPLGWEAELGGFTDARLNGGWAWVQTDGCTFEANCAGGLSSTLTFDRAATPDPVWRLTHGTSVYEVAIVTGLECTAGLSLTKVSGDGPGSVSLTPVAPTGGVTVPDCCGGCDRTGIPSTLYLTVSAPGNYLDGKTLTCTLVGDVWEFEDAGTTDCGCSPGGHYKGHVNCATTVWQVSGAASYCSPGADLTVVTCSPFLATGTGTIELCDGSPKPCSLVVSETPP